MERPDCYGNPAGLTDDVELVRRLFAAFAARDLDAALPYIAPDCELHLETRRRAGRPGPYRGHDGLREYFADVERVWDELDLYLDDFRTIPGAVITMGHVEGRIGEERMRRAAVWTWKLRDGKAVSIRVADVGALDR